uniref:Uncharacterized protein n=1 Tax=Rhizophora mucronata TaxID=61149 RepID=A0A2P2PP06_RHIMU
MICKPQGFEHCGWVLYHTYLPSNVHFHSSYQLCVHVIGVLITSLIWLTCMAVLNLFEKNVTMALFIYLFF